MKVCSVIKSRPVQYLEITADDLISALLGISHSQPVYILNSGGTRAGSKYLIAGFDPIRTTETSSDNAHDILRLLDDSLGSDTAAIFTLSYDLGGKIVEVRSRKPTTEPDLFVAELDVLIIHDYDKGVTRITGDESKASRMKTKLLHARRFDENSPLQTRSIVRSDVTETQYLQSIEQIKNKIRIGHTYQTNLTQQLSADLPAGLTPEAVFFRLLRDHPAPYSAFIRRTNSTVVSASPELFFRIEQSGKRIVTSPIKGTRPRGMSDEEDAAFRKALIDSEKDRAENTMIVDLLRNDLGRVCEYGSVKVEDLCRLDEHPTLFHLVSTISGILRPSTKASAIIEALFPCGSITGAPKLSTMMIIDALEPSARGLSMGLIGCHVPERFGIGPTLESSVAIRTMVVRDGVAVFNVGGGVVIDSDPLSEYEESLTKAKALIAAINGRFDRQS
jgi:anthranilate/para-aminobenzoate synthase component I